MYNKELYDLIYKGDINNSLYQITKIILENGTNNIEIIENTFISICSYIGSFISIYDIRLWIDVVEETYQFINSDNIVIKKSLYINYKVMYCM
jgi:HJR/Mrr/RecB family endonuclease